MTKNGDEFDEETPLLGNNNARTTSVSSYESNSSNEQEGSSSDAIVFDGALAKTSTKEGELVATWSGQRSLADSGRIRRTHSWSGGAPDDTSSEIRILRERLVRTQTKLRPGAVKHLSSHQRLTLTSLAIVDFMSFCSMSVMAPFFPREASAKGLSDTMCGLVFSFYAIVMFITSPVFGKYLPQLGAKSMFTLGMLVAGVCNILFGTLASIEDTSQFTTLCFVVRGFEALGASAYSTASYVFVVNAFPDSIGSVLGILETFVGLGMSVGPAIGGLLYSIGGFGLPFYSLGIVMIMTVPINCIILTDCKEYVSGSKSASILRLFKIPSIITTGLVIVIMSNTWAFLDPTLEPHLRQFGLSTKQIGLIFLLFSSLYGIFSPIWGWVADRVNNHWCMMVWGLLLSTVGLLLLGPSPLIPMLPTVLWLDLVALSILGISVALTLLPTFQGVLTSSIYEGGCPEALATYSAVAGVWSCCYSLGEVLGPALGGALAERYGFPLCATLCAGACFIMAIATLIFFSLRESKKFLSTVSDSVSSTCTDTTWSSSAWVSRSAPVSRSDTSPLLVPCKCHYRNGLSYGTSSPKRLCMIHNKNKNDSNSIADRMAYLLKFQYITDTITKLRSRNISNKYSPCTEPYQNINMEDNVQRNLYKSNNNNITEKKSELNTIDDHGYCTYLENAIFGTSVVMENAKMYNLKVKKNNRGLVSKLVTNESERRSSEEIIKHNLDKVYFYEQNQNCSTLQDIFEACECRDGLTYVQGTVAVSSTGACEV